MDTPDPFDDADALEELEEEIATLAAHMHAATHRLLTLIAEFARGCTTAQLERMVRGFRRGSREDEEVWERRLHESRNLSVFADEDGMYVVKGRHHAATGRA
ncbi:MAG: hypothetical protein ABIG68_14945 [Acidobacteriota bacterium]